MARACNADAQAARGVALLQPTDDNLNPLMSQAISSSRPMSIIVGTRWFNLLAAIFTVAFSILTFTIRYEGQPLLPSLITGELGQVLVEQRSGSHKFLLRIIPGEVDSGGNCTSRGTRVSGFGLIGDRVSQVSHCEKILRPSLDPDPEDCNKMTLTYAEGQAPYSMFGMFLLTWSDLDASIDERVSFSFQRQAGDGGWNEVYDGVNQTFRWTTSEKITEAVKEVSGRSRDRGKMRDVASCASFLSRGRFVSSCILDCMDGCIHQEELGWGDRKNAGGERVDGASICWLQKGAAGVGGGSTVSRV